MPEHPSIQIWYGPEQRTQRVGDASTRAHVLGCVHAPAGLHVLSYRINNDWRRIPVPVGPDGFRLLDRGDFHLEINPKQLVDGPNALHLTATDLAGNESTQTITLHVDPGSPVALPHRTEWNEPQPNAVKIIEGLWDVQDGRLRTSQVGYDRMIALGDTEWRNVQVRVPITIHAWSDHPTADLWPGMGRAVSLLLRWRRHADWGDIRPHRGWFPYGQLTQLRRDPNDPADHARLAIRGSGYHPALATEPLLRSCPPGSTHILCAQIHGDPGKVSEYAAKCWNADEPEPSEWDLVAPGIKGELIRGSVAVTALHADVSIGPIDVTASEPIG